MYNCYSIEFYYKVNQDKKTLAFKGEYINGIPLGKHRYYYPNGKVKEEGKYDSGMKEGDWKKYNTEGELILTILYKNGIEFKFDGIKFRPGLDSIE